MTSTILTKGTWSLMLALLVACQNCDDVSVNSLKLTVVSSGRTRTSRRQARSRSPIRFLSIARPSQPVMTSSSTRVIEVQEEQKVKDQELRDSIKKLVDECSKKLRYYDSHPVQAEDITEIDGLDSELKEAEGKLLLRTSDSEILNRRFDKGLRRYGNQTPADLIQTAKLQVSQLRERIGAIRIQQQVVGAEVEPISNDNESTLVPVAVLPETTPAHELGYVIDSGDLLDDIWSFMNECATWFAETSPIGANNEYTSAEISNFIDENDRKIDLRNQMEQRLLAMSDEAVLGSSHHRAQGKKLTKQRYADFLVFCRKDLEKLENKFDELLLSV